MIVKTIPKCIKVSIGAALGLFIAQLGMKNAGWMVAQGSLAIGDLTTPGAILAMIGFVIIAVMMSRGLREHCFGDFADQRHWNSHGSNSVTH